MLLTFVRRLWRFVRRDREAEDLEEEMRLHMQLRAETLERQGMPADAARIEARRRFGNAGIIEERSHDMWGFASLDQLRQDMRFAVRRLRHTPALTLPTIVVLALGIGATAAVFSAVDAALLRPLPFAQPDELVTLTSVSVPFETTFGQSRLLELQDIDSMPRLFTRSAAFAAGGLNLDDPEHPQRLNAGVVTVDFFATLGVRPAVGRDFTAEEGKPRAPRVVILSDRFWRRTFGERDVLGATLRLHGNPYTVIGIMPRGFSFPRESDLWIPMSNPTTSETFAPFRGWLPSRVVARLAPGTSREYAAAQLLSRWEATLIGADPRSSLKDFVNQVRTEGAVLPLQAELLGDGKQPLALLMGATLLLLLIACANVANLMLTDAARRRREVAVRQVLGATRHRIVRQLLVESVVLSLTGALLGLAIAPAALKLLRVLLPEDLAGVAPAQVDVRVLAFATALALATAIAFGLWPALVAGRDDAPGTIKSGGGHGATAGRIGRARRMLVGAEIALTVMLLVGAGLMLRSFERLVSQETGMRADHAASLEMTFPRGSMTPADRRRVVQEVTQELARQPGIDAAGAVNDLPLRGGGGLTVTIHIDGLSRPRSTDEMRWARQLMADSGYFRALGIELLHGRLFTAADATGPKVAMVSTAMAEKYWKGEDPVGRTFRHTPDDTVPITVIGVVGDVRESALDRDPTPQMYFPIADYTPFNVALVARSSLPPTTLLARMREAVRTVAPTQAVYNVRMMDEVISRSVAPRRTNTLLIAIFAALALVLASLGVYAVVSYGVAQRARELGIRAALGATTGDLLRLVSREMVVVIALGLAGGLAGAWALSRVVASLLYGVDVHDTVTFSTVPILLATAAMMATLVPAWRATRVNPTDVMKAD